MTYSIDHVALNDNDNMLVEVTDAAINQFVHLAESISEEQKKQLILVTSGLGTGIASKFGLRLAKEQHYRVTHYFGELLLRVILFSANHPSKCSTYVYRISHVCAEGRRLDKINFIFSYCINI